MTAPHSIRKAILEILIAATLVGFSACGTSKVTTGTGNFSTVIYIGDSLTSGYQNGSLLDTQQPHGYAALIAQQANYKITLPLIPPPGLPGVLQLVSVGPPTVVQASPGDAITRDNPGAQPTDLAVPGQTLNDLLNTAPTVIPTTGQELITDLILGLPVGNDKPQEAEAIALKPTFLYVWIGNNDALVADETGMPSAMTPIASFTSNFTRLMNDLHSQTTATLVVANIPDVTLVPYLTPANTVLAEASTQSGLTTTQLSAVLGISDGDLVNATGLAEVQTALQNIAQSKTPAPLNDAGFLSAAEVAQVQAQVAAYNQVIAQQVSAQNAVLVDANAFFNSLKAGVTINGYAANTNFLGGLFSLDGIHPTNTGYALLANKFIDTINSTLGRSIPDVDVSTVAASDPLFGSNIKPTAAAEAGSMHIPLSAARQTDRLLQPRW